MSELGWSVLFLSFGIAGIIATSGGLASQVTMILGIGLGSIIFIIEDYVRKQKEVGK